MGKINRKSTNKNLSTLLIKAIDDINLNYQKQPNKILKSWPEVIGEKLAPMTEVVSFENGILNIKVKNSTLYSLLIQHEKKRLLKIMQNKFTKQAIYDIKFFIG